MAGSPDLFANLREKLSNAVVQRVVGGIAVLVAAAIFGGVYLSMNKAAGTDANAPVAQASAPAASVPVANHPEAQPAAPQNGANASNVNNVNNASNVNTTRQSDGAVPVKMASSEGAASPVVTSVAPSNTRANAQMAHLDDHLTYQYNALGRRDPFQSLVSGDFVGVDVGGDAPPDPGGIKVVGIVWGSTDQFALVEDVRGNSLVLRKGDKVQNGYVQALKRDAVIFSLTAEGQTQSVVIPLIRKGDQNAR